MHVDDANITNLKSLWQKYGSKAVTGVAQPALYVNARWPYRCWFEWGDIAATAALLETLPASTVVPLWGEAHQDLASLLLQQGWACEFEQTAMWLPVQNAHGRGLPVRAGFDVVRVKTQSDVCDWVDIGSDAFGYAIDPAVILPLLNDQDIQILLGRQHRQPVAGALLYKTGDVIGVHQVAVKKAFQGQGIAGHLMKVLIEACAQWQAKNIVLQASQAGRPLYERLGFCAQFVIKNYQRLNTPDKT
jgi:GNAT superfamily N-acetyltransferase